MGVFGGLRRDEMVKMCIDDIIDKGSVLIEKVSETKTGNSSLFDEFHSFHSRFKMAHACQKRPNLHTNELNTTFFCSTSPLKAPIRLKPLK
jgi:hypothetical protein